MESNTWCPRLTAAMILSGSAVQVNGLGSWLVCATKRLMAAWRSTAQRKTPDARRSRLIAQQAVVTSLHEAFLPAPHAGLRLSSPPHDLMGAGAVRAQQNNLGAPYMLMQGVAIPSERCQTAAVAGFESEGNSGSHPPDSHATSPPGIPLGIQMLDLIH